MRGAARRPGRSLATLALLACGSFLVLAVSVFRVDGVPDPERRDSGTGGFAWFGRATLPVLHRIESDDGVDAFALDPEDVAGVTTVPFRVRDGDDASCLNLSSAQRPRLVGVDPEELARRDAFVLAGSLGGEATDAAALWRMLAVGDAGADAPVPAVVDANSLQWALKRKVGDTLELLDERGDPFAVQVVGTVAPSVLQGMLIVDQRAFERRYPSESGHRMFLVDAPREGREQIAAALTRALGDVGFELESSAARLQRFQAVQNAYLLVFQALGALGLLLGSAGLGAVVLRNVLERRSELAVLRAVGFDGGAVRRLVLSEHTLLLIGGVLGARSRPRLAVVPALRIPGVEPPGAGVVWVVAASVASGLVSVLAATWIATRGGLLAALRAD